LKLALAQTDVVFADPSANLARAKRWVEEAGDADLVVFPECFLTGYCVDSTHAAEAIALLCEADEAHTVTHAHDAIMAMAEMASATGKHVVFGFAGRDARGLYNGAVLATPEGAMKRYVKTHLPCLGLDRFVRPGNDLPVFETALGRIAILVCFDIRIPEAARTLALKGADLILLPTNWPTGASATLIVPARAAENTVFVAACNRVGTENGTGFIGKSVVVDPRGRVVATADDAEKLLTAEIDLAASRTKTVVVPPYDYTIDAFATRQPDLYRIICATD